MVIVQNRRDECQHCISLGRDEIGEFTVDLFTITYGATSNDITSQGPILHIAPRQGRVQSLLSMQHYRQCNQEHVRAKCSPRQPRGSRRSYSYSYHPQGRRKSAKLSLASPFHLDVKCESTCTLQLSRMADTSARYHGQPFLVQFLRLRGQHYAPC